MLCVAQPASRAAALHGRASGLRAHLLMMFLTAPSAAATATTTMKAATLPIVFFCHLGSLLAARQALQQRGLEGRFRRGVGGHG